MKLLFFDTECSSCTNGAKICEFGYVLTDMHFNILKAENLLINPQSKFNVYGFKRAGITFNYPYDVYYKSPDLKERYARIKELLSDKDVLPVGYSCDNDARFLISDFKRNGLEIFDYEFFDVFPLFKEGLKREKDLSLNAVYAETGGDSVSHHEALHDAAMTMQVLKHYLSLAGATLEQTLRNCKYAFGEVFKERIVLSGKPFRYADSGKMTAQNKRVLAAFLSEKPAVEGELENKTFCFSKDFEAENFFTVLKAADEITDRGGRFTEIISFADFVIAGDTTDRNFLKKKKRRSAKIISIAEFCEMLNILPESLEKESVDADAILSKTEGNSEWYASYLLHLSTKKSF
ncbi:MAG: hypothetical protein J6Y44_00120 [Clostridia bacterium]|nr:hypothetical protein [Clostridia bacterium]